MKILLLVIFGIIIIGGIGAFTMAIAIVRKECEFTRGNGGNRYIDRA